MCVGTGLCVEDEEGCRSCAALHAQICLCHTALPVVQVPNGTKIVLNCSGRGDKDIDNAIKYLPHMSG